jgi:hypothetical protein
MRSILIIACASLFIPLNAASASTSTTSVAAGEGDKLICRRELETGSLVKKRKVCLTKTEWQRRNEAHEQFSRDLQDGLRTKPSGGT